MRRAAERPGLDQLQHPLLPDRAGVRDLRRRAGLHLPGGRRVPRLGDLARAGTLRPGRAGGLRGHPGDGAGLRLGEGRPRVVEAASTPDGVPRARGGVGTGGESRLMSLINTAPEMALTTKIDDLLNWTRKSSVW